jgi:P-type Ca2+ transporter type 2C
MLIVYIPVFNLYFHTSPLHIVDWILALGAGVICLTIFEIKKGIHNRRLKKVPAVLSV